MKIQNVAARFILPVMVALSVALMPVEGSAQDLPQGATDISAKLAPVRNEVFNNPASPVGGNPSGDVTIVQFYDYRCGYCKAAEPGFEKLVQEDGNIKVIYKDYPFLGEFSRGIAVAALASRKQGEDKRLKFHQLLMQRTLSSDPDMYKTAEAAGLDLKQLKRDMVERRVTRLNYELVTQIESNKVLAGKLGINAVPSFIVGDYFFRGGDMAKLKELVAYVREKQQKR